MHCLRQHALLWAGLESRLFALCPCLQATCCSSVFTGCAEALPQQSQITHMLQSRADHQPRPLYEFGIALIAGCCSPAAALWWYTLLQSCITNQSAGQAPASANRPRGVVLHPCGLHRSACARAAVCTTGAEHWFPAICLQNLPFATWAASRHRQRRRRAAGLPPTLCPHRRGPRCAAAPAAVARRRRWYCQELCTLAATHPLSLPAAMAPCELSIIW